MKPDLVQRVVAECVNDWPWRAIKVAGRVLHGMSWESCYRALGRYLRGLDYADVIELRLKNPPAGTCRRPIFDVGNLKLRKMQRMKPDVEKYTLYPYLENEEFIERDTRKPTGRSRIIRAGNLTVHEPIYEEEE